MTTRVVSVSPDTTVGEISRLLIENRIGAVPVVDAAGRVLGIVSDGDLIRHADLGGAHARQARWAGLYTGVEALAAAYVKTHGRRAEQVMTRAVIAVEETTPIAEIAEILEQRHIKRVPVLRAGRIVGIVSRANLVQCLASAKERPHLAADSDDCAIRSEILAALEREPWARGGITSVTVADGVVAFWGSVRSEAERLASRIAAEQVAGVRRVEDYRGFHPQPVAL